MSAFLILRSPEEWRAAFGPSALQAGGRRTTLSVGNFDGLHLGHQKILAQVVARARATNTVAAAVTFEPHPLKVLRPAEAPPLVQTLGQRLVGIGAAGLDAVLLLHFDPAFAALPPEEFVRRILVDLLRTETILVGKNFRFGHKQQGDLALLAELGRQFGFTVEVVPPVTIAGTVPGTEEVVSSTAVRRAVLEGRVRDAARLLGRPFSLRGEIVTGSGRGSAIVFPTLNLRPDQELLPKPGVYVTQALVDGKLYGAATNVGFRPTFDGTPASAVPGSNESRGLSIESHLFDFSRQLAAGRLEIAFLERLRDERKFTGPSELRAQIASDLDRARQILNSVAPSAPQI